MLNCPPKHNERQKKNSKNKKRRNWALEFSNEINITHERFILDKNVIT